MIYPSHFAAFIIDVSLLFLYTELRDVRKGGLELVRKMIQIGGENGNGRLTCAETSQEVISGIAEGKAKPAGPKGQVLRRRGSVARNCRQAEAPLSPEQAEPLPGIAAPLPERGPFAKSGPEPMREPKKSVPQKEPVPESAPQGAPRRRRLPPAVTALLVFAAVISLLVFWDAKEKERVRQIQYDQGIAYLRDNDYAHAAELFQDVVGFRDADGLAIFCYAADQHAQNPAYGSMADKLAELELTYETEFQPQINALAAILKENEAELLRREEEKQLEQYSGKLPCDGMPVRFLEYTSLGPPDKIEKCKDYEHLVRDRQMRSMTWYNSEQQVVASCMSRFEDGSEEETIFAFRYYEQPIGRPASEPVPQTFGNPDWGDPYDVEDYGNAEDFYLGNLEDFGSLDEAELYFDNHHP